MTATPPPRGVTPDRFRVLLGGFATGVVVVTARDPAGVPAGMTASAVTAVSLDPPLVLVCIDRAATFHAVAETMTGFALNILADDQRRLSEAFAQPDEDGFDHCEVREGGNRVPLLADVAGHIVCAPWGRYDAGDHTIFLGLVIDGEPTTRRPLLHHRGVYTTLSSMTDSPPNTQEKRWERNSGP